MQGRPWDPGQVQGLLSEAPVCTSAVLELLSLLERADEVGCLEGLGIMTLYANNKTATGTATLH